MTAIVRVAYGRCLAWRKEKFALGRALLGPGKCEEHFSCSLQGFGYDQASAATSSVPEMIWAATAQGFIGLGPQAPAIG